MDEYQQALIDEILGEVDRLRDAVLAKDATAYTAAETRIKAVAQTLKNSPRPKSPVACPLSRGLVG